MQLYFINALICNKIYKYTDVTPENLLMLILTLLRSNLKNLEVFEMNCLLHTKYCFVIDFEIKPSYVHRPMSSTSKLKNFCHTSSKALQPIASTQAYNTQHLKKILHR